MPAHSDDTATKGTVSSAMVREAVRVASQRGLDTMTLMSAAGIAADVTLNPSVRVPAVALARLWAGVADAMDDEFFGLDRHPMRRGSYALMAHACLGAATLEQALQRMMRFLRAVLDGLQGELHRDGATARLVLREVHDEPLPIFAHATWLMLVHGLACWLVDRRLPLWAARFAAAEPLDRGALADYRMRFCEGATFGAAQTEVCFDAVLLDLPIVQTPATIAAFLRGAPANLLVKYRNDAGLAIQIRRRLRRQPPADWPDLAALARALRLSPATVQRRLQGEGLSYQALKDQLRRDLAIELLQQGDLPLADVAARVGYSEPSTFHRAFKKWTGQSPSGFRHAAADRSPHAA